MLKLTFLFCIDDLFDNSTAKVAEELVHFWLIVFDENVKICLKFKGYVI